MQILWVFLSSLSYRQLLLPCSGLTKKIAQIVRYIVHPWNPSCFSCPSREPLELESMTEEFPFSCECVYLAESWKGITFEPPEDFLQTAILANSCWHALLVPGSTNLWVLCSLVSWLFWFRHTSSFLSIHWLKSDKLRELDAEGNAEIYLLGWPWLNSELSLTLSVSTWGWIFVQYVHIALCLLACEMYTIFSYFCFWDPKAHTRVYTSTREGFVVVCGQYGIDKLPKLTIL
jgi:hypothetical protein